VLAQELVAFPPAAELTAGRQRHRLCTDLSSSKMLMQFRTTLTGLDSPAAPTTWDDEAHFEASQCPVPQPVKSVARREVDRSIPRGPGKSPPSREGCGGLLPGAATPQS